MNNKISLKSTMNPEKKLWDFLVDKSIDSNITQSWGYGSALKKLGFRVFRILVSVENYPIIALQGHLTKSSNILLAKISNNMSAGSLGGSSIIVNSKISKKIKVKALKYLFKIFFKFCISERIIKTEIYIKSEDNIFKEILDGEGFNLAARKFTPIINIGEPIDLLWKNLHKKHRTSIRKSSSEGTKVYSNEKFEDYWTVTEEHMRFKNYITSDKYFQKGMFNEFRKKNLCKIFFAEREGKILSTCFIWNFGDTAYYTYGASTESSRNFNGVNQHIHWEIIKYYNDKGYQYYNMWGGQSINDNKTRFKMRFSKNSILVPLDLYVRKFF